MPTREVVQQGVFPTCLPLGPSCWDSGGKALGWEMLAQQKFQAGSGCCGEPWIAREEKS